MFTRETIVGASNEGGTSRDMPALSNNVLGTKFRIVAGYAGTREMTLALERKEIDGLCGLGWTSINASYPHWLTQSIVRILVQENAKGHPDLNRMGVPLAVSFARTDDDRQVMELVYSQANFGRPFVVPPGMPAERVAALRKAFMAAFADKELIAEGAEDQARYRCALRRRGAGAGDQGVRAAAAHHRAREASADLQATGAAMRARSVMKRSLVALAAALASPPRRRPPRRTRSRNSSAARPSTSSARRSAAATTPTRGWWPAYRQAHPRQPTVVVQNIPGAGSNKAASFVALQAPKDGTTIGAIQPGAVLHTLLSDQPVPHDPRNSSCSAASAAASISASCARTRRSRRSPRRSARR